MLPCCHNGSNHVVHYIEVKALYRHIKVYNYITNQVHVHSYQQEEVVDALVYFNIFKIKENISLTSHSNTLTCVDTSTGSRGIMFVNYKSVIIEVARIYNSVIDCNNDWDVHISHSHYNKINKVVAK